MPFSGIGDPPVGGLERVGGALHAILARLPAILSVQRSDVLMMHEEVDAGARIQSHPYWLFLFASCGIATIGLITNSPAVIIGAMLISPLMAPIVGLGMGVALNDLYLGAKSLVNVIVSVSVAVLTATLITLIVPLREDTSEILARVTPTFLDVFVALLCGFIAALSTVRSGGKDVLGTVAPGAAIGVALMPPLCVVGYGIGSGFRGSMMWGAFLLFLTNLFSIVLVSSIFYYFIFEGYHIRRLVELLSDRREKREPFFHLLSRSVLWQRLDATMISRKRLLLPVFLLLLVSYPLMSSLLLLKRTAEIRLFLNRELRAVPGLQLIRGPERLSFTGDSITGSILYSAERGFVFEEKLLQQLRADYPGMKVAIRFMRIAGEADLEAMRQNETSSSAPVGMTPVQQAMLLSEQIQSSLMRRFPKEVGVVLNASVLASPRAIDRVQVEYAGTVLARDARTILAQTLRQELETQGYSASEVQLIHAQNLQRVGGCRKGDPSVKEDIESALINLRSNEDLVITLSLQTGLIMDREFLRAYGDRLHVEEVQGLRCAFRIEYSRL